VRDAKARSHGPNDRDGEGRPVGGPSLQRRKNPGDSRQCPSPGQPGKGLAKGGSVVEWGANP